MIRGRNFKRVKKLCGAPVSKGFTLFDCVSLLNRDQYRHQPDTSITVLKRMRIDGGSSGFP